ALNHANIGAIYGLDEHEGALFLAMELIEGETLEEKLKQGPLAVDDALRLALQIAEALEAAHDKGVVHRDLKPANIMVTPSGGVKVLDFGLAKAFSGNPSEASPAHSPALSIAMTQQGLILGTAGYMSPEQASGQATDQRADVWAFGVVLYEMLSGLSLFSGESVPHVLADVLRAEPDWSQLPKDLHPRIWQLLGRCLEKKPRNRYAGIADARVDIEAALADPGGAISTQAARAEAGNSPVCARRLGRSSTRRRGLLADAAFACARSRRAFSFHASGRPDVYASGGLDDCDLPRRHEAGLCREQPASRAEPERDRIAARRRRLLRWTWSCKPGVFAGW
ncbi:MAG: serine/threonine protein kinase, partial [Gammaproteobacteria bacterium]|nr:serine/threonine protein kinase [Gammaproteobacteria bacterium]